MPCVDPRCGRISAAREFPARRGGTDKTANDHSATPASGAGKKLDAERARIFDAASAHCWRA